MRAHPSRIFPAAVVALLLLAAILAFVAGRTSVRPIPVSTAPAQQPAAHSSSGPAPTRAAASPPRLVKPIGVKPVAKPASLDAPIAHGTFFVALSRAERRPNETQKSWEFRTKFLDQYRQFARQAQLAPPQENALRGALADAQTTLTLSRRVPWNPDTLSAVDLVKLESESEADIQQALDSRLGEILNSDQQKLLRRDFSLLIFVNIFGLAPLDITSSQ